MDDIQRLVYIKCTFGACSLVGSFYIVQHVARSPSRRRRTLPRIMLLMSCHDFLKAVWDVVGHYVVPTDSIYGPFFPWINGTWSSCVGFGFLVQGSLLASFLYNGVLALYFLMTIRYGWTERKCQQRLFVTALAMPMVIGWGTAIAGIPLNLYNPSPIGCIIQSYPPQCKDGSIPCQRGQHALEYGIAFLYAWWWLVFVWLVVAMSMIYHAIRKTEKRSKQFTHPVQHLQQSVDSTAVSDDRRRTRDNNNRSSNNNNQKFNLRKAFALQALLYCVAFFLSFVFSAVQMIITESGGQSRIALGYLGISFSALTGFMNAVLYIRPRYLRYRRKQQRLRQQGRQRQHVREEEQRQRDNTDEEQPENGGGGGGESTSSSLSNTGSGGFIKAFLEATSVQAKDDNMDDTIIVSPANISTCNGTNGHQSHDGVGQTINNLELSPVSLSSS